MFRVIITLLILFFSSTVLAQSPECNNKVFDATGKVNVSAINLTTLSKDGTDPLVRVVTKAQFEAAGNLDKYVGRMVKQCPSWQSPGGNIKNNLLVIAIAPELDDDKPLIGIYFAKSGPLASFLNGQTNSVRSEISGKIKSDPTAALNAGIEALHLKFSSTPKVNAVTNIPSNIKGNVTIINKPQAESKPFNFTPLYVILFLGVCGVGVWLYLRRKSQKESARGRQQEAQSLRAECNNLIVMYTQQITTCVSLLNSYKNSIHPSNFIALQSKLGGIQSKLDSAKIQFSNNNTAANDPESANRTEAEYLAMSRLFGRNLKSLETLEVELKRLETEIRKLKTAKEDVEKLINNAESDIVTATNVVSGETQYNVSTQKKQLEVAITLVERAHTELSENRYSDVTNTCKEASELANKARIYVNTIRIRKINIETALDQLARSNPICKKLEAHSVIGILRSKYGASAVEKAQSKLSAITADITEYDRCIAAAGAALNLSNFDTAETQIDNAKRAVQSIDCNLASIKDIGPSIDRENRRNSRLDQERNRHTKSSNVSKNITTTTVVNNTTIINDDYDYGYRNGILVDSLINDIERREIYNERMELERARADLNTSQYYQSQRDDDLDIGGESNCASRDSDSDIVGGSGCRDSSPDIGGGSDSSYDNDISSGDDRND